MTAEELKAMIDGAVDTAVGTKIAPLLETQRKYTDGVEGARKTEKQLDPGIGFARLVKGIARAKIDEKQGISTGGTLERAAYFLEKMYPQDSGFVKDVKALSAGGDGGYLIQEQYSSEVIPLLYSKAVITLLGARPVPMPNGNLNMPKMIEGVAASYIGENQGQKAVQPKFGNVKFSAKKLRSTSVISNDLIRSSSYQSDAYVLEDMIQSMRLAMDYAGFYGAGTDYTPRGIYNTQGVDKADIAALPDSENTAALKGILLDKNIPMVSPGWAFNGTMYSILYNLKDGVGNYIHREEMNRGKFQAYPYQINTRIPTGTSGKKLTDVFFGDFAQFMIGEQTGIEVVASTEASYTDASGSMQSAFDLDQTVLRAIMLHDMQPTHGKAFVVRSFQTIA